MTRLSEHSWRPGEGDYSRPVLMAALVVGLVIRLAILWQTPGLGTEIIDEQQYSQIARSIVAGHGFAWGEGRPTSIRPPLYPAMLAGIWSVAGSENLQAVRVIQILLRAGDHRAGLRARARASMARGSAVWAAAVCWLYPVVHLLQFPDSHRNALHVAARRLRAGHRPACTDAARLARRRVRYLAGTGRAHAQHPVAAAARAVPAAGDADPRAAGAAPRAALPGRVGYALVVAPWAVRNTRLQGVRDHRRYDGRHESANGQLRVHAGRPHVGRGGAHGREELGVRHRHGSPRARPSPKGARRSGRSARRSNSCGRIPASPCGARSSSSPTSGAWSASSWPAFRTACMRRPRGSRCWARRPSCWRYVAVVMAGAAGIWLAAPDDRRMQILLLLPVLLIMGGHTIVFGHSRYHLPLIPIFGLYAAALWAKAPAFRLVAPLRAGRCARQRQRAAGGLDPAGGRGRSRAESASLFNHVG